MERLRQKPINRTTSRPWLVTGFMVVTIVLTATVDAASLATDERNLETVDAEPRTFGRIRRLQAMIVPVMFFLGVMKTLLAFLVAISLKSLFVGVSILMINVGLALAKVIAFFKTKHSYDHHGGGAWPDKNIHVHIHNDGYAQHGAIPVEYEHPPSLLSHHTSAPSAIFPSYGPPVSQTYQTASLRARNDQLTNPVYVSSTPDEPDRYPKVLITDRDQLDRIYAGWRQLNRKGR